MDPMAFESDSSSSRMVKLGNAAGSYLQGSNDSCPDSSMPAAKLQQASTERVMKDSPKQQVLALEPAAHSQCRWEITGQRMFYVCLGDRTLAKGISPRTVWAVALDKLKEEGKRTQ